MEQSSRLEFNKSIPPIEAQQEQDAKFVEKPVEVQKQPQEKEKMSEDDQEILALKHELE